MVLYILNLLGGCKYKIYNMRTSCHIVNIYTHPVNSKFTMWHTCTYQMIIWTPVRKLCRLCQLVRHRYTCIMMTYRWHLHGVSIFDNQLLSISCTCSNDNFPLSDTRIWQLDIPYTCACGQDTTTPLRDLLPATRRRSVIWYESCKWLCVSANLFCLDKTNSQSCCSNIS